MSLFSFQILNAETCNHHKCTREQPRENLPDLNFIKYDNKTRKSKPISDSCHYHYDPYDQYASNTQKAFSRKIYKGYVYSLRRIGDGEFEQHKCSICCKTLDTERAKAHILLLSQQINGSARALGDNTK